MIYDDKDKKPKPTRAQRREIRKEIRGKKKFIKWSGLTPEEAEKPYKSYSQTTKK